MNGSLPVLKIVLLQELSDSLWKTKNEAGLAESEWEEKIKQVQEQMELRASSAKTEALVESYSNHKALLQQLFPEVTVEGCDDKHQQWLERFEAKAQELMSSRKDEVSSSVLRCGFKKKAPYPSRTCL